MVDEMLQTVNNSMTGFEKMVMKVVGTLVAAGILASIGTNIAMTISITRVEEELKYVSKKLEESTRDRYTNTMAVVDKQAVNTALKALSETLTQNRDKQGKIWSRLNVLEKEIIKLGR